MKNYFVTSDVHSFFRIFHEELLRQGFEIDNPDHILIVCGDLFDRGPETLALYNFVRSLPEDRFIYVRGNHEDLLKEFFVEFLTGERIENFHYTNGTVSTVCHFCDISLYDVISPSIEIRKKVNEKLRPVLEWIEKKSIDFYKLGQYLFVHGYVPTDGEGKVLKGWDITEGEKYDKDIRYKWMNARWLNGMEEWNKGAVIPSTTIVCGHWHCSWGWDYLRHKYDEFPKNPDDKDFAKSFQPFIDKGIMAIDACTAYSRQCNILRFEEALNETGVCLQMLLHSSKQ